MNPDTLALLALGEDVATVEERAHLAGCPACRSRIDEMAGAAAVGRTVLGLERPATPPARVWEGIVAELGLPADLAPTTVLERPEQEVAPSRRRRGNRLVLLALAAVVVLLAAGTAVAVGLARGGEPKVIARAELVSLPGWSGRSGSAEIEQYSDGRRVVVVSTNLAPARSDGHEVWLMDAATGARVGLGYLTGESGSFAVPKHVDLHTFSYIDVSAEPRDGNPEPSGHSIVRGPLES